MRGARLRDSDRPWRARWLAGVGAAASGALVWAAGCELLVDDELTVVHCSDEGVRGPPACPDGTRCTGGLCVDAPAEAALLGSPCVVDGDCDSADFCLAPQLFGDPTDPVCSRGCCSSSDCGETDLGFVCWTPEVLAGGSFCRSAADLARGEPGPGIAGSACSAHAHCRSGLCEASTCVDSCCSDANCAVAGGLCVLATSAQGSGWACGIAPEGKAAFLEPCAAHGDCTSGLCVEIAAEKRCSAPCCGSAVCGPAVIDGVSGLLGCTPVLEGSSLVQACARVLPDTAVAPIGAECAADEDCRGGLCIEASPGSSRRVCSDVCCTDASCGDASFGCRPFDAGPSWALRCELR